MIQILGLRNIAVVDPKTGVKKARKVERFFDQKWRAPSVRSLFENLAEHIEKIPEKERYNLYYTPHDCFEERGRKFESSNIIAFDIDGIEREKALPVAQVAVSAIGVEWKSTAVVFSGNGVQIIIETTRTITNPDFFESNKHHYGAILDRIQTALTEANLLGKPDPAVFHRTQLMRLPGTLNRKPGKTEILASFLQPHLRPVDFDLAQKSGIPNVLPEEQVSESLLKHYPAPDTDAILSECEFLKWNREHPEQVSEPQWYAMGSIVARLDEGEKLFHEMSEGHPDYTKDEADLKFKQSLENSGPRTCKNIDALWGKCQTCVHFNKIVSPIVIRGPDYIRTKDTGFHDIRHDSQGNPRPGKPNFEDLRKFFEQKNKYVTLEDSEIVYIWKGTHWAQIQDASLKAFAQEQFKPAADTKMRNEFRNIVAVTNLRPKEWFDNTVARKMNFQNGVLDIDTMELAPHSIEHGFRYVLPYDYNPTAQCPRFELFLDEITSGDESLQHVLMEFAGYAFSNDECWEQKALVMSGEGSNGKSTFMDVLRSLAGADNYTSLNLADLKSDANRYQLVGKLFNLSEETPTHSLLDSSLFKNLVSGGDTVVKMLYKQPFTVSSRAKLMLSCNELPKSRDTTHALFRRLLIVPFNRTFTHETRDRDIKIKLHAELPGIFNLVIQGYKRLLRQKAFSESATIRGEIATYKESIDSVVSWFNDFVRVGDATSVHFATSKKLYDSYKMVSESRGYQLLTYDMFCKKFKTLLRDGDKRAVQQRHEGKVTRGFRGIQVVEDNDL